MSRLGGGAVLALLGAATPAAAHTGPPPVGVEIADGEGQVVRSIRIAGLYPTAEREVVLFAPDGVRRIGAGVAGIGDRENGCGRPEVREGDVTCGDGDTDGELSAFLEVTLTPGRSESGGCTPAGSPVRTDLRVLTRTQSVVGLPDRNGRLCVIAGFRHREGPGDDVTQTDSTRFDLRLALEARPIAAGSPGAAPVVTDPPAAGPPAGSFVHGPPAEGSPGEGTPADGPVVAGAVVDDDPAAGSLVAGSFVAAPQVRGTVWPVPPSDGDGVLSLGAQSASSGGGLGFPLLTAGVVLAVGCAVFLLRVRRTRSGAAS